MKARNSLRRTCGIRLSSGTSAALAAFVPNDVELDAGAHQLVILTGPNMGGKSTFLRQTALLAVLAQTGSFVAARSAKKLAIVDRIFARVGASDNIARGQSTVMVEMQETAAILHTATSRSLVIRDEIGQRGTATFDGFEPRLGGRRAPGDQRPHAAQDDFRDALSRAHGLGRRDPLGGRIVTSPRASSRDHASSSCTRSCRAAPIEATAFKSRASRAYRRPS